MLSKDVPVISRSEAAEGSWLPAPIFRRHLHRSWGLRLRSRPSPGSSFSPTNDLYGTAGPAPEPRRSHTARRGFASSLFNERSPLSPAAIGPLSLGNSRYTELAPDRFKDFWRIVRGSLTWSHVKLEM